MKLSNPFRVWTIPDSFPGVIRRAKLSYAFGVSDAQTSFDTVSLPHRSGPKDRDAAPPRVEAQPRRWESIQPLTERQSHSALPSGKAAKTTSRRGESARTSFLKGASFSFLRGAGTNFAKANLRRESFRGKHRKFTAARLTTGTVVCLAVPVFCVLLLLPPAPASSQAAPAVSQTPESQPSPSPSPTPSPSPSPSPSPTPVTGLHQWGAVTLFHGLPSDRVHAIAQGRDGAMWFGTEA